MASIELQNVNKWYGNAIHAVRDISFKIEDGEFFGLLGPSGSGKTSVLRMLAGLESVTEGDILFDGVSVTDQTPQQRNIAMVFEQNALYPHMTARQNIGYPLKIRGKSKDEMDKMVGDVARMLHIDHLIDRRASQMSGGQQQRVAIARALVRRPNLLCLDEPIAHLDTLLRARLRGELKRLQRSLGTTSVIVTHDPIEAMTMTDRLAVMRDGVLQQIGSPDDIHNRPVNAFVSQFFGLHSMNLFRVDNLKESAGAFSGQLNGTHVDVPRSATGYANGLGQLLVGCRPHAVILVKEGETPPPDTFRLTGRVYVAEPLGEVTLVTIQVGDLTVQALDPRKRDYAIDEEVIVTVPQSALYAFDTGTEATIAFGSADEPLPTADLKAG
ncbi:ABC transporter ATP-binding protein [Pseudohoeflea suaedae]|uniref:ABC transporter ATP-binding protein n=1 Tax=Pseudohoeflea suaedae TaxID=877384 RepID=A0A4V3A731_9HYPH|nr:ABC transporter ATP-binding protein [Pseudohoeflea suaedae]TDH36082.1 ABC transporter ATP-binding protein [Pseudohoeflea suaedae]